MRLGDVADVRISAHRRSSGTRHVARRIDVVADVQGREPRRRRRPTCGRASPRLDFPLEYHAEVLRRVRRAAGRPARWCAAGSRRRGRHPPAPAGRVRQLAARRAGVLLTLPVALAGGAPRPRWLAGGHRLVAARSAGRCSASPSASAGMLIGGLSDRSAAERRHSRRGHGAAAGSPQRPAPTCSRRGDRRRACSLPLALLRRPAGLEIVCRSRRSSSSAGGHDDADHPVRRCRCSTLRFGAGADAAEQLDSTTERLQCRRQPRQDRCRRKRSRSAGGRWRPRRAGCSPAARCGLTERRGRRQRRPRRPGRADQGGISDGDAEHPDAERTGPSTRRRTETVEPGGWRRQRLIPYGARHVRPRTAARGSTPNPEPLVFVRAADRGRRHRRRVGRSCRRARRPGTVVVTVGAAELLRRRDRRAATEARGGDRHDALDRRIEPEVPLHRRGARRRR